MLPAGGPGKRISIRIVGRPENGRRVIVPVEILLRRRQSGDLLSADLIRKPGRFRIAPDGYGMAMFLFFSNRLGCAGSILVSVVLTVIVLLLLGVIGNVR